MNVGPTTPLQFDQNFLGAISALDPLHARVLTGVFSTPLDAPEWIPAGSVRAMDYIGPGSFPFATVARRVSF
jgi:hypothetical protein